MATSQPADEGDRRVRRRSGTGRGRDGWAAELATQIRLRLLIQRLTRHQFGRRSEQLTPDQLHADPVPPSHIRRHRALLETLGHDLKLLLRRPGTPAIRPDQHLNLAGTSALTITRMSGLTLDYRSRRLTNHAKAKHKAD